jgi:hypothetical protein
MAAVTTESSVSKGRPTENASLHSSNEQNNISVVILPPFQNIKIIEFVHVGTCIVLFFYCYVTRLCSIRS